MEIGFDPNKNAINVGKHGIPLDRAVELEGAVFVEDQHFAERRLRIYGLIDGRPYCAAAVLRGSMVRIINLRRAHSKEFKRYVR